jgi:hypothetical protein
MKELPFYILMGIVITGLIVMIILASINDLHNYSVSSTKNLNKYLMYNQNYNTTTIFTSYVVLGATIFLLVGFLIYKYNSSDGHMKNTIMLTVILLVSVSIFILSVVTYTNYLYSTQYLAYLNAWYKENSDVTKPSLPGVQTLLFGTIIGFLLTGIMFSILAYIILTENEKGTINQLSSESEDFDQLNDKSQSKEFVKENSKKKKSPRYQSPQQQSQIKTPKYQQSPQTTNPTSEQKYTGPPEMVRQTSENLRQSLKMVRQTNVEVRQPPEMVRQTSADLRQPPEMVRQTSTDLRQPVVIEPQLPIIKSNRSPENIRNARVSLSESPEMETKPTIPPSKKKYDPVYID